MTYYFKNRNKDLQIDIIRKRKRNNKEKKA